MEKTRKYGEQNGAFWIVLMQMFIPSSSKLKSDVFLDDFSGGSLRFFSRRHTFRRAALGTSVSSTSMRSSAATVVVVVVVVLFSSSLNPLKMRGCIGFLGLLNRDMLRDCVVLVVCEPGSRIVELA